MDSVGAVILSSDALVLAVAVEALDDRTLGVGHGTSVHIAVDGGVGDAHFLLVRLAFEKPGGGSLVPDGHRRWG